MINYTDRWNNWIFNQNNINNFGPDCTEVSVAQIFGLNYDLWLTKKELAKAVDEAIKDGVLTNTGANFNVIYPWNVKKVESITGEKLRGFKTSIGTSTFKKMLDKGYNFGLGLIHGNTTYTTIAKKDGSELTKENIDSIKSKGGGFCHNHVYGKREGVYGIYEIYTGKFIKCSIETLKYGVDKGVWRRPARTFLFTDKLLEKALLDYKNGIDTKDVQNLPELEQKAIFRASQLIVFKK